MQETLLFSILSHSPLFQGIEASNIRQLFENSDFQLKQFQKGELLVSMGEPCLELQVIITGSVKGEMSDLTGKTIKIEDIHAPRPVAAAFLFGKKNCYPVNITTNEDTTILVIPQPQVMTFMQQNAIFLHNYLNMICSKAQFLSQKLEFLSLKTIREKLAHYLLSNTSPQDKTLTLPSSQEEMAVFFGVTRPAFARVLKAFQEEGLIEFKRREISLVDRKGLISILEQY